MSVEPFCSKNEQGNVQDGEGRGGGGERVIHKIAQ